MKRNLAKLLAILILATPLFTFAYDGLVFCSGISGDKTATGNALPECTFITLLNGVNWLLRAMIYFSIPIATGLFAYAGFLIMYGAARGEQKHIDKAKGLFWHVVWGLVLMLGAVTIVKAIFTMLTNDPTYLRLIE